MDSPEALRGGSHSPRLPSARRDVASAPAAPAEIRFRLPATLPSASVIGIQLADWLRQFGIANRTIFDLQLASTEALTMMIGQPGNRSALMMEVEGTMIDNTVTLTMREFGLCRQPGDPRSSLNQELSLNLIEAMTDTLDIHETTQGRVFTLRRRI